MNPNKTEQDLINLGRLATQQKNERVIKITINFSKQNLDKNLAESFAPIIIIIITTRPLLSLPPVEDEEFEEVDSDDLERQRIKVIIPSNIIDIWTKLEVLLRLKISRHTDFLTEASYLVDEINKKEKIESEKQY